MVDMKNPFGPEILSVENIVVYSAKNSSHSKINIHFYISKTENIKKEEGKIYSNCYLESYISVELPK